MRLEAISGKLRRRFYYTVPGAGGMIGLGRSQSYEAAEAGQIPTERIGKFLLVPRKPWDRKVKRLLGGRKQQPKREAATAASPAAA